MSGWVGVTRIVKRKGGRCKNKINMILFGYACAYYIVCVTGSSASISQLAVFNHVRTYLHIHEFICMCAQRVKEREKKTPNIY